MRNVDMLKVWIMAHVRGPEEASACLRSRFRDLPIIFFRYKVANQTVYALRAPSPRQQVRPIGAHIAHIVSPGKSNPSLWNASTVWMSHEFFEKDSETQKEYILFHFTMLYGRYSCPDSSSSPKCQKCILILLSNAICIMHALQRVPCIFNP